MKKTTFCSIILFVMQLSNFVFGVIPAEERAALIALYDSTNGDYWSNRSGWKTLPLHTDGFARPGTEGSWDGVTVSGDHVIYLRLNKNNMIGTIPPGLGNLTNLRRLSLNENQLRDAIPSELGNLSHLESLWLYGNQLGGDIPSQFGNLSNLQRLELDNNELTGAIPPELGNLSHLKSLCLNQNQLSGDIPSSLMNLTKLTDLDLSYNCLYTTDPALIAWLNIHNPDWELYQDQCSGKPEIALNRTQLNFGVYNTTIALPDQTVSISNSGKGVLNWYVTSDIPWLAFCPSSGTGSTTCSVIAISFGKSAGVYTGILEITDPNASNSPQTIPVTMHIYEKGKTSGPFGEFITPLQGSSVYNSIPVTGWALDDIGIGSVNIYNGDTFIGCADLVDGARPDVEAAYPTYPYNYKAGWGYMLLTNFLPNGGNGTYTLIVKAIDMEGNEVILGTKTITVDNAHAGKPFGAIDTPIQGGAVSGKKYVNYGWALTPQPNMIPFDGSTINVVIDGVVKGQPVYDVFRSDIASLFPGYANTDGAVGYYYLDTTKLKNGVHTIAWTAADDAGNSDGIGSRYFTVQNIGNTGAGLGKKGSAEARKSGRAEKDESRRGAPPCAPFFKSCAPTLDPCAPVFDETKTVEIKELERVEINLSNEGVYEGYLVVGDQLRELPIGSTLDKDNGIFYWQPGPGFVGTYRFMFIETDRGGNITRKHVLVNISPKSKILNK